jgi:regulator of replication initiation timing
MVKRNALDEENQKLQKENQRLCDRLRTAEIIIDVQKKVAALLGRPILSPDLEERP